ncbi:MAG: hypothetical protein K6G49_03640 [Candidatus Saccharibacteria bacterium]|nr:hypothetical protein [Candidatus Saccharibacteria bacterium]
MARTSTINVIKVQADPDEYVEYMFEDGHWSRSLTIAEMIDGTREVTISTIICPAEDVITTLLLSMGQEGVEVSVRKRGGTAVPVQGWRDFSGLMSAAPRSWFMEGHNLKIESSDC